jgi:hypothetical protein
VKNAVWTNGEWQARFSSAEEIPIAKRPCPACAEVKEVIMAAPTEPAIF